MVSVRGVGRTGCLDGATTPFATAAWSGVFVRFRAARRWEQDYPPEGGTTNDFPWFLSSLADNPEFPVACEKRCCYTYGLNALFGRIRVFRVRQGPVG